MDSVSVRNSEPESLRPGGGPGPARFRRVKIPHAETDEEIPETSSRASARWVRSNLEGSRGLPNSS